MIRLNLILKKYCYNEISKKLHINYFKYKYFAILQFLYFVHISISK